MGEGFGVDMPRGHSLQAVVADRASGPQASLHVSLVDQSPLRRTMAPNTGEAVGLQLELYGKLIAHSWI